MKELTQGATLRLWPAATRMGKCLQSHWSTVESEWPISHVDVSCLILFLFFFLSMITFFFKSCPQNERADEIQDKVEQQLNLLYPNFHGSSSTRENSRVFPFLPMVTCKQLLRRTDYLGQGTVIYKPLLVGSREAIEMIQSGHCLWYWVWTMKENGYTCRIIHWFASLNCYWQPTRIWVKISKVGHVFYGFSPQPNYNNQH